MAGYNGTFTVTSVLSATSFTYTDPTTGLAASGGGSVQVAPPTTIADLMNQVATQSNGRLTLGINAAGTGLALFDNTNGSGQLTVQAVAGSQAATGLGLVNPQTGIGSVSGSPAITLATQLSLLNGGRGVAFTPNSVPNLSITFADQSTLNITFDDDLDPQTVGDIISQINTASGNSGRDAITATINAAGNGLVLTGTQAFSVQSPGGATTAADLGLAGASTGNTLNGANIYPPIIAVTPLSQLNGGRGVGFSSSSVSNLTITFADKSTLSITFTAASSVGDIIDQINNAPGNSGPDAITAALNVAGNGLVLTATQSFTVQSQAGATTAADLGLAGASTGNTLNGTNIYPVTLNGNNLNLFLLQVNGQDLSPAASLSTPLTDLNGGNGVSFQGDTGNDLEIRTGDGTPIDVALGSAITLGDVVNAINAAAPTKVQAILSPSGRLVLTDLTKGTTVPFTVGPPNGSDSTAADDLGIDEAPISAPINVDYNLGDVASLSTVLTPTSALSAVNGGQGVQFAAGGMPDLQVNFQNGTSIPVSLAGSMTIGDVVNKLNAVTGLTAAINQSGPQSGLGLVLTDGTSGQSAFTVTALNNSPAAAELGILGTGDDTGTITGANIWNSVYLQANVSAGLTLGVLFQAPSQGTMLTSNTSLSTLQGGQGIQFAAGGMPDLLVTLHNGTSVPVTLGGSTTIGTVLEKLNAEGAGKLKASISQNGLGLVLTDLTSGQSAFTVTALNDSSAPGQLGILGVGDSTGTIQGTNLSGASLGSNVIIQNASLGGSITIGGNVNATATFGFLGVSINGGSANANAGASFQLGNLEGAVLTSATPLTALNGGQGVQFAAGGMPDLQVNFQNGTSVQVTLAGSMTIGDILTKLNAAAPGKLTAAISASGLGLVLTDLTSGQSMFTVTPLSGSPAANELGIAPAGALGTGYNTLLSTGVSSYATLLATDVSGYSTITDLTNALTSSTTPPVGLSVMAANPGPTNGQAGNGKFQVQVGNGPIYTVTIQNSAVANPASLADLISNLNSSLKNAKGPSGNTVDLSTQVRALNSGGNVAFTLQGGEAQYLTILNATALGFSSTQANYIVRPSVNLNANVNLPVAVAAGGIAIAGLSQASGAGIKLNTPRIPFDLDFGTLGETPFTQHLTVNLGALNNFTGLNFTTFINVLNVGLNYLNDTVMAARQNGNSSLAFLDQPLPLVNVSLAGILNYATTFTNFVTQIVNTPSGTPITGTVPALSNGVLTAPAHFQLILDNGTPVSVTVPANSNNTNLTGLVNDINTALSAAGLGGQVVAGTSGGVYITLMTTGTSPASSLVVQGIAAGDPAATQLGLSNGQTSASNLQGLASEIQSVLQGLLQPVQTLLGSQFVAPQVNLKIDTNADGSQVLELDLNATLYAYQNAFPLAVSIPGSNFGFDASANLNLTAAATFQLAVGLPLSGPSANIVAAPGGATEGGTLGSTVTINTATPLTLQQGNTVTIAGVGVAGYNGTFVVTSVSGNSFTYTDPTTGLAASGGGTVQVAPQRTPFLFAYNAANGQGTGLVLSASAATPINVNTNLGSLSVSVKQGYAVFNSTGTATVNSNGTLQTPTPAQVVLGQTANGAPTLSNLGLISAGASTPIVAAPGGATEGGPLGSTVTINTTTALTLQQGNTVTISNVGVAGYNGTFVVTGVSGNSFTYTDPTTGLAASGGGTVQNAFGTAAKIGLQVPIYVGNTQLLGQPLTVTYDLTHPLTPPSVEPGLSQISAKLKSSVFSLSGLSAGFDAVIAPVLISIKDSVLASDLPVIGSGLADAASFILNLKSDFDQAFRNLNNSIQAAMMQIYNVLGPNGLNLLLPIPGNNLTGAAHYIFAEPLDGGYQFYIHLGQTLSPEPLSLAGNLDLPGLGLNLNASAALTFSYDLQLGFGVNATDGVYIDSSKDSAFPTSFNINAAVTLPNTTFTGTLGYLQLNVNNDEKSPTSFSTQFAITLTDPSGPEGNQHLTAEKLGQYGVSSIVSAAITAKVNVNLDLSTSFTNVSQGTLPELDTVFNVSWPFSVTFSNGSFSTSLPAPTIAFNQVKIDLGSYFSSFVRPILTDVQNIIKPIQPLINVLETPIPVLSALAGRPYTLLNMAKDFAPKNSSQVQSLISFTDAVLALNKLVLSIPTNISQNSLLIPLGSFTVSGMAAETAADAGTLTPMQGNTLKPLTPEQIQAEIQKLGGNNVAGFTSDFTNLNSVSGTSLSDIISFPILSNPGTAFQLLLGNNGGMPPPSLFQLKLPTLTLGLGYTQTFPVPGTAGLLSATLGGQVSATFSFTFGFDTFGLSEYLKTNNVADIFDGFYILDPPDNQENAPGVQPDHPECRNRGWGETRQQQCPRGGSDGGDLRHRLLPPAQ